MGRPLLLYFIFICPASSSARTILTFWSWTLLHAIVEGGTLVPAGVKNHLSVKHCDTCRSSHFMITLICLLVSPGDVISLPADDWASKVLISDSCIVGELPVFSTAHVNPPSPDGNLVRLLSVIWCPADSGQEEETQLFFYCVSVLRWTPADRGGAEAAESGGSFSSHQPSSHQGLLPLSSPFTVSSQTNSRRHSCVRRLRKESWRGFGGRFGTNSQLKTAGGAGRNTSTRWRAGT